MRLLLQRVLRAEVRLVADGQDGGGSTGGPVVGRIDRGWLAFVGVAPGDGPAEVAWATAKLRGTRAFGDTEGRMNLDLDAVDGAVLLVSQFTLYGDLRRGRRPGFSRAAPPDEAERRYLELAARLRAEGVTVATGAFGRTMAVELVNDGPVTLWLDSEDR